MDIYLLMFKSDSDWIYFPKYFNSFSDVEEVINKKMKNKRIRKILENTKIKTEKNKNYLEFSCEGFLFRITKLVEYGNDFNKCCICFEKMKKSEAMRCKHFLCKSCAPGLRSCECPICRKRLTPGGHLTKDIIKKIKENEKVRIKQEEEEDRLFALELSRELNTF